MKTTGSLRVKIAVVGFLYFAALGIGGCSCEDSPTPTPITPEVNPPIPGTGGSGGTTGGSGGAAGSGGTVGGTGGSVGSGGTGVALCGNGRQEVREECDDANTRDGDGCSSSCHLEPGYRCPTAGRPCVPNGTGGSGGSGGTIGLGGSGGITGGSGGAMGGMGGTGGTPGTGGTGMSTGGSGGTSVMSGSGGVAGTTCGNGRLDAGETCDDRNTTAGDGCSATCRIEPGYTCPSTGGACASLPCYKFTYSATVGTTGNLFEKQTCATHFDATNLTNNTRADVNFSHPLYSPDGRTLAVDSSNVVFSLDRAASPTRLSTLYPRVTPYPISLPSLFQWSPDSLKNIFAGYEGEGGPVRNRVIKMATDPDHIEKIIFNNDSNIIFEKLIWPQVADTDTINPFRNKIVVSMQLSASAPNGIYLYDRTRRDIRQLREQPEGTTASVPLLGKQPALFNAPTSPGASAVSLLVFVRPDINRVDEIFGCIVAATDSADPVCSHTTQLTFWGINSSPCFTYDGQYILFTSEDPYGHHKEIWMVNQNNALDVHQVTNNPEAQNFDPACFPRAIDPLELERVLHP